MNVGVFVTIFTSTSVELFETAAIAYAIARFSYSREAILGTVVGLTIVIAAAAGLVTTLQLIPLSLLQIIIGLMLWFG